MKFEDYRFVPEIKKSILEMGFKRPTDIQYKAITPILKGEDVLAVAQTGTGKTAAFAIPVLQLLATTPRVENAIRALVLAPTRELAIQIEKVFSDIAKYTKIKTLCVVGGIEQDSQVAVLESGVDVLIATPGRMFDLIYQKHISITKVKILVLDEADKMLEMGFINDIRDVKKFLPKEHQTLFFSATISLTIKDLAYSLVRSAIRIQVSPQNTVSKNVEHSVAKILMDDKRFFLEKIVKEHPESKILVFVRTKVRAERVLKALERVNIQSVTLHGDKDQNERNAALKIFTAGTVKVLVTTDVSARGIDIKNVEFVVNYDLPDLDENYVHRVGRTGRGDKKGWAVTFCSPEEEVLLASVEKYLGGPIPIIEMGAGEYEETKMFSEDVNDDWKSLMKSIAKEEQKVYVPKRHISNKKKK